MKRKVDEFAASAASTLKCPITSSFMFDPVTAEDGHIYERTAIEEWLKRNGSSPITREKMGTKLLPSVVVRVLTEDLLKTAPLEERVEWLLSRAKMEPIAEAVRLFECAAKLCNEEGHEEGNVLPLKLQEEVKMCLDLAKCALSTANSMLAAQALCAVASADGFDTTWLHKTVPVPKKLLKEYRPLPRGTRIRLAEDRSAVLKAFAHMMVNWNERTMACCLGAEMLVMISDCDDEMYLAIPTIDNKMMHEMMMYEDDRTLQRRIESTMKYGNWWPCGTFYLI